MQKPASFLCQRPLLAIFGFAALLLAGRTQPLHAQNCAAPSAGLLAWWTGNDGSDSISTNHGVLRNGALIASGKVGVALSFDGVNDYFEVPDSPNWPSGTEPFTIEFWVRINANKSSTLDIPAIIFAAQNEGPGDGNKWFFALGEGKLFFHVTTRSRDSRILALAPFSPTLGRWHHLAVVRSENLFQIYADATLIGAELNGVSIPDVTAPLTLGQSEQIGFLKGQLDEVSFYNRPLQQSEIAAIVAADSSGKCTFARPPQILVDARDVTTTAGEDAAFSAAATGTAPLEFQWFFREEPLSWGTNSVLVLTNVGISQQGKYRVVVTNAQGVATGADATLTVLPAPGCLRLTGAVGWWKGEDAGADSRALNNGILRNGVTTALGKVGNGFVLDGIDDFIEVADNSAWPSGTRPFTIEFWVNFNDLKPSTLLTPAVIFAAQDEGPGSRRKWFFAYGGGMLNLHVTTPNLNSYFLAKAPFSPAIGRWYHLALKRSGDTFQIFVDGVLAGSEVNAVSIPDVTASLTIGQGEQLGYLNGMIDEFTVFDRALSESEIQAIRDAGITGKCPPRQVSLSATVASGNGSISISPQLDLYLEEAVVQVMAIPNPGSRFAGWDGNLSGLANPVTLVMNGEKVIAARFAVISTDECFTPPSMVGWWRAEASAQDASLTNHGVLRGGNTAYDRGVIGAAFSFNGTNSYVEAPDSDLWAFGTNDFTIEFWINFRGLAASADVSQPSAIFIGNDEGPGVRNKWFFYIGGGKLCFHTSTPQTGSKFLAQAPFTPVFGEWYHLALVRSGTLFAIYRDGVLSGSESAAVVVPNPDAPLTFGQAEGLFFLNGLMDEISIYRRALARTEIEAIWIGRSLGKCGPSITPAFVSPPRSQTVNEGARASFEVGVSGSVPIHYQWFHGTNALSGETNASLVIPNARLSHAGQYSVSVSNAIGSVASSGASLTVLSGPPCVSPGPNLAAWWRADGDAQDTVSTNHGTLRGATVSSTGKVRSAFSFTSKSTFVEVPDSDLWSFGANPFSIEFWVNFRALRSPSTTSEPAAVFVANDEGPSTLNKWIFSLGNNSLCLILNNAQTLGSRVLVRAPFTPALGQWYHLALVRDGNTFTIYRNGVAIGAESDAVALPNPRAPLTIGHAEGLFFLDGMLDELAIYRRALTPSEILAIFQADTTGKCEPQFFSLVTSVSGGGTIAPLSGTNTFVAGAAISLQATAFPGNRFAGWSGGLNGFANPGLVLLDSNKTVTAIFVPNAPPSIQLTNPANGEIFSAPAKISIEAAAFDSDGTISKVEFYRGTTLQRSLTARPYSFTVTNLGTGQYTYSAKATDNDGTVVPSLPVTIRVGPTNSLLLTVASRSVRSGAELVIPVTARGFSLIRSLQFSAHWDPSVLSYRGVEQFGLPALTEDNFGVTETEDGTLLFSWDDPSGTGQTRPEDSILFGLRFGLIGTNGVSSTVLIDGTAIIMEAVNASGTQIPVLARAGEVQIHPQPGIRLIGTVRYYDLTKTVSGAPLAAAGDAQQNVQSGTNGLYEFLLNPGSYKVTPRTFEGSQSNLGVTTADISLIRRHILRIARTLETPYKLLAADVDNSGAVTTADIGLVRRLILDNSVQSPFGLWRFVRSDQAFDDPQAPWGAEGFRSYTNVTVDVAGQDFIAIKLGDVNSSWTPAVGAGVLFGSVKPLSTAGEGTPTVTFKVNSAQTNPGGTVKLKVSARGSAAIATVQFTLHWDPLLWSFSGTGNYGLPGLSSGNFGSTRTDQGILTFAWDDLSGNEISLSDGGEIFSVSLSSRGTASSRSVVTFVDQPVIREVTALSSRLVFGDESATLEIVIPPQIVVGSIKIGGGNFEFIIAGRIGENFTLQTSNDLVRWTTVTTLVNTTGNIPVAAPITARPQFFRIISP